MSTLPTAEAALLDLVRAYNNGTVFNEANSAIEDWRALDVGTNEAAVVTMEGATEEGDSINGKQAHAHYYEQHRIALWVCVARGTGDGGDDAAKQECKALTEAVKDFLRPYERLNNATGVLRAQIVRTDAPIPVLEDEDARYGTHMAQQIVFLVLCRAALDPVEVAAA